MKNSSLKKFGPAGDSRFQQCYRCDFSYDVLRDENLGGCPACGGCGECGCCPCNKPSCAWCADEPDIEISESKRYDEYERD